MKSHVTLLLCPCCGDDVAVGLHKRLAEVLEAKTLDTEPCAACKTKFDEFKSLGFVLFVVRDEYERRTAAGEADLPTWPFFYAVHVTTHDFARRVFVGVDFASGCAFISQSLCKRLGIDEAIDPL